MPAGDVRKLTPRQKQLLRLVLDGYDAKSAARELGISVHTVNEHLTQARRHLGVSSSREAARILQLEEAAPPRSLGRNEMGVAKATSVASSLQRPGRELRLVFAGVALVSLTIAVAIALSVMGVGPLTKRSDAVRPVTSARTSTAEANPSPYQFRSYMIRKFDQLRVSGPFKVGVLASANSSAVEVQGPPQLLADTIVQVEGSILTIRFREGAPWSWNPGSGMNVVVSTPALSAAKVEGAAQVDIIGVRGNEFRAQTDGSGSIDIRQIDVDRVQLTTAGAGGINVEGRARMGTYMVGSSGSIDAKRLKVKNASIAVGGAGSAFADVSDAANVSVNGSGRIEVVGGATCTSQPSNSRQIDCR
jgi:DNA-binding CsgD family transcriptional regulator